MRVLIAFDKFKDALGAPEACHTVAAALRRARPAWQLDLAPLSDGGDGFCRILTEAAGGTFESVVASGPRLGASSKTAELVSVQIGWVDLQRLPAAARARLALPDAAARRLAVIEMAAVNGLALVPRAERDVWHASSRGTGELLAAAARSGAQAVLLGVGGSATSDLGLGALDALGLGFEASDGSRVSPLPAHWAKVARVTGRVLWELPLRIACDVDNPLLGARGAAAVYGPQKGLSAVDLPAFEAHAARLARLLSEQVGSEPALAESPGAGAAGGIAFGLLAAVGARLVSGFALVSEWLDLAARAARSDWVITGEGRFDATSLAGKGPGALAALARDSGRRALVLAGAVEPSESGLSALAPSVEVHEISPRGLPLDRALGDTRQNLARAVEAWLDRSGV